MSLFLNQVRMRKALPFAVETPPSASMGVIEWRRQRFILRKSLRVRVGLEGGVWVYEYEPLGILAHGSSQAGALDAFRLEFASAWERIAKEDDAEVNRGARGLKKRLPSGAEPGATRSR